MHRRLKAGISLSIVLLGTILVPATAQAATVVRSYEIEKTSSDYTRGSVYFYNRLVEVIGQQEAEVQGIACRYTKATTNLGTYKYSQTVCNGGAPYDLVVPADVAGGAASVTIDFYLTDGTRTLRIGTRTVYRAHS
jgi:hypothetical protein